MESVGQAEEVGDLNSQSNATDQNGSLSVTTADSNLLFSVEKRIDKDTSVAVTAHPLRGNSYTDALSTSVPSLKEKHPRITPAYEGLLSVKKRWMSILSLF